MSSLDVDEVVRVAFFGVFLHLVPNLLDVDVIHTHIHIHILLLIINVSRGVHPFFVVVVFVVVRVGDGVLDSQELGLGLGLEEVPNRLVGTRKQVVGMVRDL